jgi:hypothetical protein
LNDGQRTLGVTTGAEEVVDETELDDTLAEEGATEPELLELLKLVERATDDELEDVTQPLICRAPQTPESATAAPTEDLR